MQLCRRIYKVHAKHRLLSLLAVATVFLGGCYSGDDTSSTTPTDNNVQNLSASGVEGLNKSNPGCLTCHANIEPIHPNIEIACTDCHGGNYLAVIKDDAHVQSIGGITYDDSVPPLDLDLEYQQFVNPSNLRVVENTCGRCHESHVDNVKKSLMANTAGHHSGGLYQAGIDVSKTPTYGTFGIEDIDGDVPTEHGAVGQLLDLISWDPSLDQAEYATHFRAVPEQACVRCHLWTRGKGYRGATAPDDDSVNGLFRADGCAACHMVYANDGLSRSADQSINHNEKGHPISHRITNKIPAEQCIHCHHRGSRIGLNFTGRSQMPPDIPEGVVPGTDDQFYAGTTTERFNGNYHYADYGTNPPDIHGELGMDCIDCHTQAGIMGDGNIYGHMDQATKIECRTCHGLPHREGTLIDKDGLPLNNVTREENGDVILTSKVTGVERRVPQVKHIVDPLSSDYNPNAAAAMNDHHIKEEGGLECYSCHSSWMPNCFGCHFEHDQTKTGKNLLTGEATDWKATTNNKLFVSLKHFAMGSNAQRKISPFIVGCHPIADVTADDGTVGGKKILDFVMPKTAAGKSGLAHNPVNPHTTRSVGEVRTCVECHRSPPSLGLGSGNYTFARNLAFMVTNEGVRIFERWDDPGNPVLITTLASDQAPQAVATIPDVVSGRADYLFVANGAAGVNIYFMNGEIATTPIRKITDVSNAIDVSYAARYLYIVDQGVGVKIYDLADPFNPTLVSTVDIPNARRAVLWGIDLFVAAGDDGVYVVDVSDHTRPVVHPEGRVTDINAADITLYAHFQRDNQFAARAYVADPDYGIRIIDLLPEFSAPTLMDEGLAIDGGAYGLDTYTRYVLATSSEEQGSLPSREHDFLYVAAGSDGLRVYDITFPDEITLASAKSDLSAPARDVDVISHPAPPGMDDYAYVATDAGLDLLNVINPFDPTAINSIDAPSGSRVFVEVQQLDRFLDEQGNELKENSHPGASPLNHAEIVRLLRTPL